jgi:hypothetical protein
MRLAHSEHARLEDIGITCFHEVVTSLASSCKSTKLRKQSQLLSPHVQKLPVLRRAPPTPRLTPDTHRNGGGHTQHDHNGVEREYGSVARGIDEVLQRLSDGEVDARRADCKDDDDLAGDLYKNKWSAW